MVPHHWFFTLPGTIVLPAIYAAYSHYERDYHGLLLSRAP